MLVRALIGIIEFEYLGWKWLDSVLGGQGLVSNVICRSNQQRNQNYIG